MRGALAHQTAASGGPHDQPRKPAGTDTEFATAKAGEIPKRHLSLAQARKGGNLPALAQQAGGGVAAERPGVLPHPAGEARPVARRVPRTTGLTAAGPRGSGS